MRPPAPRRYVAFASVLMFLPLAVLAASSGDDLGTRLTTTEQLRLLRDAQTAPRAIETESRWEPDTASPDDFELGVRNRVAHERAARSTAVGAPVPAQQSQPLAAPMYEPDYSVGEWWRGASQTTKTCTIVGAAVVFLIIFL